MITSYSLTPIERDEDHHLSEMPFIKIKLETQDVLSMQAMSTPRRPLMVIHTLNKRQHMVNIKSLVTFHTAMRYLELRGQQEEAVCSVSGLKRSDFDELGKSLIQKLKSGEKLERSLYLREI